MGFCQPSRHLLRGIQNFVQLHLGAEMNSLGERHAVIECHHYERMAVARGLDPIDCTDVGMVEGRGKLGFLDKALFVFLAGKGLRRKGISALQSAFQLKVTGPVHHPHTTLAHVAEYLIVAGNEFADCERTLSATGRCCSRGVCVSHRF